MKTFEDLVFKPHPIGIKEARQAVIKFDNSVELSVIIGSYEKVGFYSNGINTYEAYCMNCEEDEPMGYLTTDEVTAYMIELQNR